jgi:hypothetical protein
VVVQALPADLAGLGQLRIVDAGHNALRSWKSVQVLPDLPRLRQLNLMGNPLTTEDDYRAKVRAEPNLQASLYSEWGTEGCLDAPGAGSMAGTFFECDHMLEVLPLGLVGKLYRQRVLGRTSAIQTLRPANKASLPWPALLTEFVAAVAGAGPGGHRARWAED